RRERRLAPRRSRAQLRVDLRLDVFSKASGFGVEGSRRARAELARLAPRRVELGTRVADRRGQPLEIGAQRFALPLERVRNARALRVGERVARLEHAQADVEPLEVLDRVRV